MNDLDILKSISENLSERKSSAALNNYIVLCNNIKYVNDLFQYSIKSLSSIQNQLNTSLQTESIIKNELKDSTNPLFYLRKIIPRILLNDINVSEKFALYTLPDNREGITVENVGKLSKRFLDYNNLVTTARQFIDSMVSDAYQLTILDAKEINYHVLVSLNSFNKYVTKSIRQSLFNEDIEKSLKEFEKLNYNQWANSSITKCSNRTFGEKVDFLFTALNLISENTLKDDLKSLFKFSSEFTHIGYISTFFSSSADSEVIFGDEISPYLPSTENFSELKYEILETAVNFYGKVYLPTLVSLCKNLFENDTSNIFETSLNDLIKNLMEGIKTRNNEYYFFIREGMIGSSEVIDLTCMCKTTNHWSPPHDLSNIYCKNCGSKFNLLEIEGDPGYIITSNGPVKVIGSSVPDFDDLPLEKKIELLKTVDELLKKNNT